MNTGWKMFSIGMGFYMLGAIITPDPPSIIAMFGVSCIVGGVAFASAGALVLCLDSKKRLITAKRG